MGHAPHEPHPESEQPSAPPWFAGGLRFECTQCGQCCTGPPGYVSFTADEANRMAHHLGITLEQFHDRYTHDTPAGRSIREVKTDHGFDCVFLDRTTHPGKALCSLYDARPTQCRTFPWWPEHLRSPDHWNALSRECEGVGRGDFVPVERILAGLNGNAE